MSGGSTKSTTLFIQYIRCLQQFPAEAQCSSLGSLRVDDEAVSFGDLDVHSDRRVKVEDRYVKGQDWRVRVEDPRVKRPPLGHPGQLARHSPQDVGRHKP